jgi:hypothetical protein
MRAPCTPPARMALVRPGTSAAIAILLMLIFAAAIAQFVLRLSP